MFHSPDQLQDNSWLIVRLVLKDSFFNSKKNLWSTIKLHALKKNLWSTIKLHALNIVDHGNASIAFESLHLSLCISHTLVGTDHWVLVGMPAITSLFFLVLSSTDPQLFLQLWLSSGVWPLALFQEPKIDHMAVHLLLDRTKRQAWQKGDSNNTSGFHH